MFPSSLFYIARVTKNEKILFTTLKLCVNILDLQLSDLVKTKFDKIKQVLEIHIFIKTLVYNVSLCPFYHEMDLTRQSFQFLF